MLDTFTKATPEQLANVAEEMKIRGTAEVFLLFNMGGQYNHLIVQKVAKLGVYCLVADPAQVTAEDIKKLGPIGIIGSGGPASVYAEKVPFDKAIYDLGIPVLGICLSSQMIAEHIGLTVSSSDKKEFGVYQMELQRSGQLFDSCSKTMPVLQNHGDRVEPSDKIQIYGFTENALAAWSFRHLYGVQFHPEVSDTIEGEQIFANFCFSICHAKDRFPAEDVGKKKIIELRSRLSNGERVALLLSGGSDSSVAAHLFGQAVNYEPGRIRGVYFKGLDRPDDYAYVQEYFAHLPWLELIEVDLIEQFLAAFAGKMTMKEKRAAMSGAYFDAAENQIRDFSQGFSGKMYIAQGTLYTDISESGGANTSGGARKAVIKKHHNVGHKWSVEELIPLADCVKDGARAIGRAIGVPEELLIRHPFPGPGLAVRIEGEITRDKLIMEKACDGIWIEELRKHGHYQTVWQAGAVLTASEHTYAKGDDAGSGPVIALWAVWSVNGFTARAAHLPMEFLTMVADRIGNEVSGVGAVTYRINGKPFGTIEWG